MKHGIEYFRHGNKRNASAGIIKQMEYFFDSLMNDFNFIFVFLFFFLTHGIGNDKFNVNQIEKKF